MRSALLCVVTGALMHADFSAASNPMDAPAVVNDDICMPQKLYRKRAVVQHKKLLLKLLGVETPTK